MSNNKQIEKPLELPHQETIVGTNTIQTKPFDNQKIEIMSNNKQSSVEWLVEILGKYNEEMVFLYQNEIEQAKAMHKEEIENAYREGWMENIRCKHTPNRYYNETFGGNNEQQ